MKKMSKASLGKKSGLAFFMEKKKIWMYALCVAGIGASLLWQVCVYQKAEKMWQSTDADAGCEQGADACNEQEKEKKKIALTFDDGPHPLYTQEILAVLSEADVKATFFMMGKEAEIYPGKSTCVSFSSWISPLLNHTKRSWMLCCPAGSLQNKKPKGCDLSRILFHIHYVALFSSVLPPVPAGQRRSRILPDLLPELLS